MNWRVKHSSSKANNAFSVGQSGRAQKLYALKLEARKIREAHAAGQLTAEQAARKLDELYKRQTSKSKLYGPSLLRA